MANRNFAQISCTLTSSKKIRGLSSDGSRWAYICAHLSELGNYAGLFRYPVVIWASDVGKTIDEMKTYIVELEAAGLIEYDFDEEIIRIVSWFHKKNAPENASRVTSLSRDYNEREIDNTGIFLRSLSEFVVGSSKRAIYWSDEENSNARTRGDRVKFRETMKPFLAEMLTRHGEQLLAALYDEMQGCSETVQNEIHTLSLPLMQFSAKAKQPPCDHPDTTVRPYGHVDDMNMKRTRNENENENVLPEFSENGDQPETEHQEAVLEEFRTKSATPKRSSSHASQAAKDSALARGVAS